MELGLCTQCGKPLDIATAELMEQNKESEKKEMLGKINDLNQKYDITNQKLDRIIHDRECTEEQISDFYQEGKMI